MTAGSTAATRPTSRGGRTRLAVGGERGLTAAIGGEEPRGGGYAYRPAAERSAAGRYALFLHRAGFGFLIGYRDGQPEGACHVPSG